MLSFPPPAVDAVRQIINANWSGGVQRESSNHNSLEIKIRNNPWTSDHFEGIAGRQLLTDIFSTFYCHGWEVFMTSEIAREPSALDTIIFRAQPPEPDAYDRFAIAFDKMDLITFIGRPDNSRDALIHDFIAVLGFGVQKHKPHKIPGCYDVRLKGTPFSGSAKDGKLLWLQLLAVLEQHGWEVYADIKQTVRVSASDTWHCRRRLDLGHAPSAPEY